MEPASNDYVFEAAVGDSDMHHRFLSERSVSQNTSVGFSLNVFYQGYVHVYYGLAIKLCCELYKTWSIPDD